MGLLSWIVVGFVAGALARWIIKDDRTGCIYTMIVGVLGAVIGGWLVSFLDADGVNDVSVRSIGVAVLGAVALLMVLNAIAGRGATGRKG